MNKTAFALIMLGAQAGCTLFPAPTHATVRRLPPVSMRTPHMEDVSITLLRNTAQYDQLVGDGAIRVTVGEIKGMHSLYGTRSEVAPRDGWRHADFTMEADGKMSMRLEHHAGQPLTLDDCEDVGSFFAVHQVGGHVCTLITTNVDRDGRGCTYRLGRIRF